MTCARIINKLNQKIREDNVKYVAAGITLAIMLANLARIAQEATELPPVLLKSFFPFIFLFIKNNGHLAQPRGQANQANPQAFNIDDMLTEEKKTEAIPFPAKNEKQLLAIGFPLEFVPDKFLCDITAQVMDNPVIIPTSNVTVKKHWENFELEQSRSHGIQTNPYDPSKNLENLQLDHDLKAKIDAFISRVVVACEIAKRMQTPLTSDDYKKIATEALEPSAIASTSHSGPSVSFSRKM